MITSHTFDVGGARADQERIELHIGRISTYAAGIDQKLTKLLALLLKAEQSTVESVSRDEHARAKLKFLERALETVDWPHG